MTDTADVRTALRALATDTAPATSASPAGTPPSVTVTEAVTALDDVHDAAAFVDDDGLSRLRGAIETADCDGDDATARRGRRALAALERCRCAAADHFHSGHGTVLSADRQGPTE